MELTWPDREQSHLFDWSDSLDNRRLLVSVRDNTQNYQVRAKVARRRLDLDLTLMRGERRRV